MDMECSKMFLILTVFCLLSGQAIAMSTGPPAAACTLLQPQHIGTIPQTTASPSQLVGLSSTYTPGDTVMFAILLNTPMKGFIIQARRSEFDSEALGTFTAVPDGKQRTMSCGGTDDTASHMNSNDVTFVNLQWTADSIDQATQNFRFYYSVVESFNTYWVRASSESIQVVQQISTTQPPVTQPPATTEAAVEPRNYALLKSHGSIMTLAWGLLAPIGIMLALFYKVVWPNGEWFYSHLAIMIATLLLTLVGIIVVVIHASGLWLTSTTANLPHQILGIVVVLAVGINPFMAILRCDPGSRWRFIFNWTHGLTGLIVGQGLAMATMLLGLHVFKDLPGVQRDILHYAIYVMSAIVGLVILIIATYNLYSVTYRKHFPTGPDELATTSEPPGAFPDKPLYSQNYEHDDDIEPSRDFPLRAGAGIVIITVMVLLTLATIVLIALA